MFNRLPIPICVILQRIVLLCTAFVLFYATAFSQACVISTKMDNITFPAGTVSGGFFTGMLRKLPAGYATDLTKKYPLIIYLPGLGAQGDGSSGQLCRMISDMEYALPDKIEKELFPATVTNSTGQSFSFIVLSVQYNGYDPAVRRGQQVDDLITYAIQNYRVDPERVYLTGASNGAVLTLDYVGSSATRAQRVAAIAVSSSCMPLSIHPDGPGFIASTALPTWFVHCTTDLSCNVDNTDDWVEAINAFPNAVPVRYDRLEPFPGPTPWPVFHDSLIYCKAWTHNTWPSLYTELIAPTGPNGPNGPNPNLYTWLLDAKRALLPVLLKSFTARLVNGKVHLRWITTAETNNQSFTIERAGSEQRFAAIGTIPGSGNSGTERTYEFVDDKPLTDINYYRLLQTDVSGAERRFEVKRIMNRNGFKSLVIIASNPFAGELSAFINVSKPQKVLVTITDINGKRLVQSNSLYAEGTTEISLPTTQLPRGIYFLKAAGESVSAVHKIIKQ